MSVALSYSRMRVAQCPFAYHKIYIEKLQTPSGDAADYGGFMHDLADKYAKADLPADVEGFLSAHVIGSVFEDRYAEILDRMLLLKDFLTENRPTKTECKWAVNAKFKAVSFWAEDAVWRGILDYFKVLDKKSAMILDYKNRKTPLPKAELEDGPQLTSYAMMLKARYPALENFTVGYYYFPLGGPPQIAYRTIDQINELFELAKKRQQEIRSWKTFPAIPCDYCQWCYWEGECVNEQIR